CGVLPGNRFTPSLQPEACRRSSSARSNSRVQPAVETSRTARASARTALGVYQELRARRRRLPNRSAATEASATHQVGPFDSTLQPQPPSSPAGLGLLAELVPPDPDPWVPALAPAA